MSHVTAQLARAASGLSAACLIAACTTLHVGNDYDRTANFGTYHTFTLLQREHPGIPNPLVATRVEEDIKQELQRRGYALTADATSADFVVDFTIGSQERTDISSYPAAYAGPWFVGGPYWGGTIDVRQYHEGTLGIDIFDARTHRPVWHGWAKKELTQKDFEQPAEPVGKAVSSVLGRFPPA
jgi:Domain of unknown function (DUF4136)